MADIPPSPANVLGGTPPVICAECGKSFNENDMIRHGNVSICANCKPIFMQKLAEGARIDAGALRYAGFGIRFGASFIDGIILQVVFFLSGLVLAMALAPLFGPKGTQGAFTPLTGVLTLINYIIACAYETFCVGKWGATVGKMACKIKVVTPEGGPISYGRSFGRYFGKLLSGIILCIGYLMIGFDSEKRGLHDRICNTRVVYK